VERPASELDAQADKQPHTRLSNRQYQIMLMLASGKTISQIAGEISLSIKTISTYRTRMLEENGDEINRRDYPLCDTAQTPRIVDFFNKLRISASSPRFFRFVGYVLLFLHPRSYKEYSRNPISSGTILSYVVM
jgi:DNA-binding CsgD family transcriptional regulator